MDPRHQTPERLAEAARNRRTSWHIAGFTIGALLAFLTLGPTVPAVTLGLTRDLASTEGTVTSSHTKTRPSVPSRPDGTSCVASVAYTVEDRGYTLDVTLDCPERGDVVAVQYDPSDPASARLAPTLAFWVRFAFGLVAALVALLALAWPLLAGRLPTAASTATPRGPGRP